MRNRKCPLPGLVKCVACGGLGCRCKSSPMKSLGKKITRALGGGRKIAGCKYNPGG